MSEHWYDEQGKPAYEIERSDGKGMRATTIRDARKYGYVPSVSGIIAIPNKEALNKWKTDQVLKAVLANPYNSFDSEQEWIRAILNTAQGVAKEAAEKGSAIHDALEKHYLGMKIPKNLKEFCSPAINLLKETFGDIKWVTEASFSHKNGFGGKCDLHLKRPTEKCIVLDFKTKSAEDFSKVKAYDEHCMQLVAYREGFDIPDAECYNLFISTKEPGKLLLHKWEEKECQRAWKMFSHLLNYWKELNNFV